MNDKNNVCIGVTVENQETANQRIPLLLQTPALVRFVSIEPMLGPIEFGAIDLAEYFCPQCDDFHDEPGCHLSPCCNAPPIDTDENGYNQLKCTKCGDIFNSDEAKLECPQCGNIGGRYMPFDYSDVVRTDNKTTAVLRKLDLVIVGGECGPHDRPSRLDWVRSIRNQCEEAGVPFFFKQFSEVV